jgi:Family of unknown function (DUF6349)
VGDGGQLDLLALLTEDEQGDILTTPPDPHNMTLGWSDHHNASGDRLVHHGLCRTAGCRWKSKDYERENDAVEAAMDHAWPGWRNLPVVASKPHDSTLARWLESVADAYPPGWVAAGGPVRTRRPEWATRHHWDGEARIWDVGVPDARPR